MTSRCTIFNRVANFCRNILSRNEPASSTEQDAMPKRGARDTQAASERPVTPSASEKKSERTTRHEQNTRQIKKTVRHPKRSDVQTQKRTPVTKQESITVIPRADPPISRDDISDNALKVLYRLNKNGYEAYLVGEAI